MANQTSPEINPSSPKVISRRNFLKGSLELGAGIGSLILFGACKTDKNSDNKIFQPPLETKPGTGPSATEVLSEDRLKEITRGDIRDFAKNLNLQLSEDEIVGNIVLVPTIQAFQAIQASNPAYVPRDEISTPAITTDAKSNYGQKMFFNKASLDHLVNQAPPQLRPQAQVDLIHWVNAHELAHLTAAYYESDELHSMVFEKMLVNHPEIKGKKVEKGFVFGARVYAYVDGKIKNIFQSLEEAEAQAIRFFIVGKRSVPLSITIPNSSEGLGVKTQVDLLNDLLSKMGGPYENNLKTLAKIRTEIGGREKFCRLIGEKFNIHPDEQLFFGMSVLFTIDLADSAGYQTLTRR